MRRPRLFNSWTVMGPVRTPATRTRVRLLSVMLMVIVATVIHGSSLLWSLRHQDRPGTMQSYQREVSPVRAPVMPPVPHPPFRMPRFRAHRSWAVMSHGRHRPVARTFSAKPDASGGIGLYRGPQPPNNRGHRIWA